MFKELVEFIEINKAWLFSGFGVQIILVLGTVLYWGFKHLYNLYSLNNKHIYGMYETYYYKPTDNGIISKGEAEIKFTFKGIKINMSSHINTLKGSLKKFYNNYNFSLITAKKVPLEIVCIKPLDDFDYLLGTFCCIRKNGTPIAGKILFEKQKKLSQIIEIRKKEISLPKKLILKS